MLSRECGGNQHLWQEQEQVGEQYAQENHQQGHSNDGRNALKCLGYGDLSNLGSDHQAGAVWRRNHAQ